MGEKPAKKDIVGRVLNFLDNPEERTLVIEYEGKRLNAIFGFQDDAMHSRIHFRALAKALKMKVRQPVFKIAKHLDGGEFKNGIYRMFGANIGRDVFIAPEAYIDEVAPELITICDGTIVGERAAIMAHEFSIRHARLGRVNIGKKVVVGAFSTVRSGVSIGDESVVAMNSFVNCDVPSNRVVGGVPASEIKKSRKAA